jgi:hypothetical protein
MNARATRERWEDRQESNASEDRSRRLVASDLEKQWIAFLSHPSVEHSLNLRVDLTLKQRRATELKTCRPAAFVEPWYDIQVVDTYIPEINGTIPVRKFRIAELVDNTANVHLGSRRRTSLKDGPLFAPFYYLTEDEARRIAIRVMNRLNKKLFGNAARRTHNPMRLTALICQHDKNTRRHLHCLFAVPPAVPLTEFQYALQLALRNEPFIYDVQNVENIRSVPASILYNTDEQKSLTSNPIVYLHPQLNRSDQERQ